MCYAAMAPEEFAGPVEESGWVCFGTRRTVSNQEMLQLTRALTMSESFVISFHTMLNSRPRTKLGKAIRSRPKTNSGSVIKRPRKLRGVIY